MKALIAMSGGVDSSVAAKLTKEAGFECVGCTMQLFGPDDAVGSGTDGSVGNGTDGSVGSGTDGSVGSGTDGSVENAADARRIAERLGMPFHVFDLKNEFRSCVIDKFVDSYSRGVTPNPCIDCNRTLKFGMLMRRADELGCSHIATGHYARIERDPETGKFLLRKGADASKDQSYVLYQFTQEQLERVLLPLGNLTKTQVRELAAAGGFENAERPESQDICFVPDGDYAAVIKAYSGREFPPGDYVDLDGNVIGTHRGIIHYTIGQHKGLGQAFGEKRYVCRIDAGKNQIVLGSNEDTFTSHAKASQFNWISGEVPKGEIRCRVRVRYKQKEQWATVRPTGVDTVEIFFDESQRAITPGQAAVLYDEDIVLGGGTLI